MHRLWLISYDVACPRRRHRLDRVLRGLGERVLESLWECRLGADQIAALDRRLSAVIRPAEDRLSLLPVCADCQRRIRRIGRGGRAPALHGQHFLVL